MKGVGGGVTIDSGIHNISMIRWIIGNVEEVTAFSNRLIRKEIEGEVTSRILFKHVNDAMSVLILSWAVKKQLNLICFKPTDLRGLYGVT